MSAEIKKEIPLEIAHVLCSDIVGYSKLLINEQRALRDTLSQIVRSTEEFRNADAAGKLIKIPTGDGMALVFYNSPEAPVECALEISRALKGYPDLPLRMGVHSGPISGVIDVNGQTNVAGAGINMAQRVMDCGDAGHILLSKHVADDLEQYPQWRSHLHDLGETEVKHGVRLHVVNLYTEELGNPAVPEKFKGASVAAAVSAANGSSRNQKYVFIGGALVVALGLGVLMLRMVGTDRRAVRANSAEDHGRAGGSSQSVPEKSIAVLPFENLSEEKANAFFADGVQDEILTDLARVADLKVISRTSVIGYRDIAARNLRKIGEELGVAHLLEGSVQRAGNHVRVNAQLIDARTDVHLWGQTYDRDLADVFAIQSEIAKAIADQLQAKLSPNEKTAIERAPTTDVTAFDLYSRARTLSLTTSFIGGGGKNLREAVDLLNQAVARDPSFFLALCQLGFAHDQLYFLGIDHTPARLAQADAAVQAAFRLRPDAGETHLARAQNFYRGHLDYEGALSELEIARRTLPNNALVFELTGYIARRQGKEEEGLRYLERALELDPRNFQILQQIALSYWTMSRYREAVAVLDRVLEIKPDDAQTKVARGMTEFGWKADPRPLRRAIDEIRAQNPAEVPMIAGPSFYCALAERDAVAAAEAMHALGDNYFGDDAIHLKRHFGEGLIARMTNDEAKAQAAFTAARAEQEKVVEAQSHYGPALCVLGLIDAGLGRKEEALREGRRAMELLPLEKDTINGAHMIAYFAITAAWVGEKELACEELARALQRESYGVTTYGALKLLPYWDPLRDDPRFEKIVESLAPKEMK